MATVTCKCGKCGAQQIKFKDPKTGTYKKEWIGGNEQVPVGAPEPTKTEPKPLPTIQEKRESEKPKTKPAAPPAAPVKDPPAEPAEGNGWLK